MHSLPTGFKSRALAESTDQSSAPLVFRMTSKVSPEAPELRRIHQAFSNGWLAAQNRKLTHYGIHMNRPEFEYIVSERFYDARQQANRFVNLPAGRTETAREARLPRVDRGKVSLGGNHGSEAGAAIP